MPVIIDFGHACLASDGYRMSQSRANQLGDGCVQPKAILSGSKPTSVASDMYCLGQILSQMRLIEESTQIKRIHDWISEFASFCRSHMTRSTPGDRILFKYAYNLIEILGCCCCKNGLLKVRKCIIKSAMPTNDTETCEYEIVPDTDASFLGIHFCSITRSSSDFHSSMILSVMTTEETMMVK